MLKGKLTISRRSDDVVCVELEDERSSTTVVHIEVDPQDFGRAITGLSFQPALFLVGDATVWGKQAVRESRTIECPLPMTSTSREQKQEWLRKNAPTDGGWRISTYLGAQSSVMRDPNSDGCILRYKATKYVDPDEGNPTKQRKRAKL